MTGLVKWIVAAAIGGFIGASIWAAITYFSGYEIGWIAWGVGFVVGLAVRVAAGNESGVGPGAVAAVGAVAALLAGKYAAIHFLVEKELAEMPTMSMSAEDMMVSIADEVVEEMETAGKTLNWPAGQTVETAEQADQYPAEVWTEATTRWAAIPAEEQQKQIAERTALMQQLAGAFQGMATNEGFKASFSPIDFLFFGLAIFTAFKLGSGVGSE